MQGSALYIMLGLIALTTAIIYLLPKLTKAVPATLVGILVISGLVVLTGLLSFHLPNVPFN
jgi:sulfate permease, SulP family